MTRKGLVPVNILRAAADPTVPTPIAGDVYFNTTSSVLRYYNGSAWADLGGSGGSYSATVSATAPSSPTTGQVWLDTTAPGLSDTSYKAIVRAATTANITLSGAQTIDGVSVVAGDRVLVKDQSTASGNGIYVAASGAWVRATDANTAALAAGMVVVVAQGTVNGGTLWSTRFKGTDTLGTTAMYFTPIPTGFAAGVSGTISLVSASTGSTTSGCTFPTGRFSVTPIVIAVCDDTGYVAFASGITTSGFQANIRHINDTAATVSRTVSWVAIQMLGNTAAG